LKSAQAKVSKTNLKTKLGVVVHACDPSYSGGRGGRVMVWGQPKGKSMRPYLKIKLKAKGLWCKSSGRALA
jgi:hypothetical protein